MDPGSSSFHPRKPAPMGSGPEGLPSVERAMANSSLNFWTPVKTEWGCHTFRQLVTLADWETVMPHLVLVPRTRSHRREKLGWLVHLRSHRPLGRAQ